MQVGVIGPVDSEEFAQNVADGLRCLGHSVTLLGPARHVHRNRVIAGGAALGTEAFPRLDAFFQRRIVRTALDHACEVVVNIDLYLMPEVVERLQRNGIRTAFWFPDHVANLRRQLMLLSPYDALFFKEPHIVELGRSLLDLPIYYLPEACNPRWHRPIVKPGTEPYLVVAGNMYPYRVRQIERLLAVGVPIRIYGPSFPRWIGHTAAKAAHTGKHVSRNEKAMMFRSASGVLNTMFPAEMYGGNGRLFQAAGCGAAVLTEYRSEIPKLFAEGDEVLIYRNFDELVDNAMRLLGEEGLTESIGDAAARRAHREHTYAQRMSTILAKIA